VKVLIIDDQTMFAGAMEVALRNLGVEVVGVARTGAEGLELLTERDPDAVLLDMGLPDQAGMTVGREILERWPQVKVLALTALRDGRLARDALRAGFSGYLTKDADVDRLVRAIESATSGEVTLSKSIARQVAGGRPSDTTSLMISQLTERELDVLALLAEGADSADIMERLGISRHTVRTHVGSILAKLNVHSRLEAVSFAVRHGVLTVGGSTPRA
jgi:NarL family two-component system response regulator LiaR